LDVSSTIVTFANGAIGTVVATNTAIPNAWIGTYRVVTKNLFVDFEDANHGSFTRTDEAWHTTVNIASDKNFLLAETLDLIAAIRDDGPTRTPMREGARSLDLVLTAARSAQEDRMVELAADSDGYS
jgi:predicted dehydrogenase